MGNERGLSLNGCWTFRARWVRVVVELDAVVWSPIVLLSILILVSNRTDHLVATWCTFHEKKVKCWIFLHSRHAFVDFKKHPWMLSWAICGCHCWWLEKWLSSSSNVGVASEEPRRHGSSPELRSNIQNLPLCDHATSEISAELRAGVGDTL